MDGQTETRENQPTINIILQEKLDGLVNRHTRETRGLVVPQSPEEFSEEVTSDPQRDTRKQAVQRLKDDFGLNYRIGAPQELERLVAQADEIDVKTFASYMLEAAIVNTQYAISKLGQYRKSLELAKEAKNKDWIQEAQTSTEISEGDFRNSAEHFARMKWLVEHSTEPEVERDVKTTVKEVAETPRSYLK